MKKHLSLNPQRIDENNWYYEENGGIVLVHEVLSGGKWTTTDQILIPWRLLRKTFQRLNKN